MLVSGEVLRGEGGERSRENGAPASPSRFYSGDHFVAQRTFKLLSYSKALRPKRIPTVDQEKLPFFRSDGQFALTSTCQERLSLFEI